MGKRRAVSGRFLIGVLAAVLAVALGAASCGGAEPKSRAPPRGPSQSPRLRASSGPARWIAPTNDPAGAGEVGIARVPDMNIVGGEDVDISALPWTVALFHSSYPSDNLCGSIPVSPTRVLTAGHCVVEANHMLGPTGFRVVAGRTRLNEGGGQEIAVAKVWAAAKYDIERYRSGRVGLRDPGPGNCGHPDPGFAARGRGSRTYGALATRWLRQAGGASTTPPRRSTAKTSSEALSRVRI